MPLTDNQKQLLRTPPVITFGDEARFTNADRTVLRQHYPESIWNLRETLRLYGKRIRLPQGQLRFVAHPGQWQAHEANKKICGKIRENPQYTCSQCRTESPVDWRTCWTYPQLGSDDPEEARRNRR